MPNVARFDAGTLKLQQMIKWDVFLEHGVDMYLINCSTWTTEVVGNHDSY